MINLTPQTQYPAILPLAAFWHTADKQPLGAVSSWAGQLFNNPATQGTAANQPVNTANLIGGKPAIVFDGIDDNLSAVSTPVNRNLFSGGGTIAGVFRPTGAGGSNFGRILDKSNGATNGYVIVFIDTHATEPNFSLRFQLGFSGGQAAWTTPTNSVVYNTSYFFIITYDSSSALNDPTIYINSSTPRVLTVARSSGTVNSDAANAMFVGNRTGLARALNGSIAEICGFRTILTGTNLNLLINYFRLKYGL